VGMRTAWKTMSTQAATSTSRQPNGDLVDSDPPEACAFGSRGCGQAAARSLTGRRRRFGRWRAGGK
jgi:hypothetical protein